MAEETKATLEIKILKISKDISYQGQLIFNNNIKINFTIAENELLKIHNNSLLLNEQKSNTENIYVGKFISVLAEDATSD